MTEISEAAKAKAREICGSEYPASETVIFGGRAIRGVARFIQQVSDAAKEADLRIGDTGIAPMSVTRELIRQFILPEPDPLVDVFVNDLLYGRDSAPNIARNFTAALERRGLKIVPVQS